MRARLDPACGLSRVSSYRRIVPAEGHERGVRSERQEDNRLADIRKLSHEA